MEEGEENVLVTGVEGDTSGVGEVDEGLVVDAGRSGVGKILYISQYTAMK